MAGVNVEVTDQAGKPSRLLDREMRLRGFSHRRSDGQNGAVGVYRTRNAKSVGQAHQMMANLGAESGQHFRFRVYADGDVAAAGEGAWVEV
ncbi:hypothetical protein [Limnoglobus roseus]|uniref:Uncharacterized protein n=1 Tax=Limnoglobus roseus TaxID=2598579 RepID=A0A5C1AJ25_9BACT|nr:hypothetical protein [Limnoglobus roseus]QEL17702.1 hypothetical protein PX52LOC_04701 [Limnoglobus roseus]